MESVGFKEWALVCEALGRGEQNIILRKGGIAEGRDGFGFRHEQFFLFPTFFHEQKEKIRGTTHTVPEQRVGEIEIKLFAKVEVSELVTSWETARVLESFHILQPEVVRERFDYDAERGIHVAFVRIFRLEPAWKFADAVGYGGCRSWVNLPPFPEGMRLDAIVSDQEHARRFGEFRKAIHAEEKGSAGGPPTV